MVAVAAIPGAFALSQALCSAFCTVITIHAGPLGTRSAAFYSVDENPEVPRGGLACIRPHNLEVPELEVSYGSV